MHNHGKISSYTIDGNDHIVTTMESGELRLTLPIVLNVPYIGLRQSYCVICSAPLKPKGDMCRDCQSTGVGIHLKSIRRKISYLKSTGFVSNYSRKDVAEKREAGMMDRYGSSNIFSVPEFQDARKKTMMERYGAEHTLQSPELLSKYQYSLEKNHGVVHPMKSEGIRQKKADTMTERYGSAHALQNAECMEKLRSTNLQKYGVEYAPWSDEIKQRMKRGSSIRNYGTESIEEFRELFRSVFEAQGLVAALDFFPNISRQIALRYFLTPDEKQSNSSIIEGNVRKELAQILGIEFYGPERSIIPGHSRKEIDIVNHDHKISVEFDGVYWHRDSYHKEFEKARLMREAGFTHLSLNELDLDKLDIFASIINPNKKRLHARKLTIKEVDKALERRFFEENHIQGYIPSKICLGLFDAEDLIQCMSFGKPRFNVAFDWEILRLATRLHVSIVGGSRRLFSKFLKECNGSVVSYSDNRYFSGKVYSDMDMSFDGLTSPGYRWVKGDTILSRYQTQKHKLSELLDKFDPDATEDENMKTHGFVKVYDFGHSRWVWNC